MLTLKHPKNRMPNDKVENLFDSGYAIYNVYFMKKEKLSNPFKPNGIPHSYMYRLDQFI